MKLKSYRKRFEPEHPVHTEAKRLSNAYKELMNQTKSLHWKKFIENARDINIWLVHKTVTGTGSDGGRTRLPALQSATGGHARDCDKKARVLHREFFPPPPEIAPPSDDENDPGAVEPFREVTNEQIRRAIDHMDPWKAVMTGDVPNAFIKKCADILVPYLGEMYRATFRLDHYPSNWRIYDTIVLRKPGRKDYTRPNSYRPICLLKTIAKPLSIAVTEYLSHLAEKHSLLPDTHFGFQPGRSTTDALLTVDKFVKNAWHDGDVVSGLFLDVKGAFPSVHIPRLTADLRRKGIPTELIKWIERKLDGRRTTLVFDNYRSRPLAITAGLDQGCPLSGILYNFYNAALGELKSRIPRRSLIPGFADDVAIFVQAKTFAAVRRDLGYLINDDGIRKSQFCCRHVWLRCLRGPMWPRP
jgi:hypothetical protein